MGLKKYYLRDVKVKENNLNRKERKINTLMFAGIEGKVY